MRIIFSILGLIGGNYKDKDSADGVIGAIGTEGHGKESSLYCTPCLPIPPAPLPVGSSTGEDLPLLSRTISLLWL